MLFYLFVTILVVTVYYYYDDLYIYIKPYFDKARKEEKEKEKEREKEREKEKEKENTIKTGSPIIGKIKELTNLPFEFLHKLCVTYGIFPMKKDTDPKGSMSNYLA